MEELGPTSMQVLYPSCTLDASEAPSLMHSCSPASVHQHDEHDGCMACPGHQQGCPDNQQPSTAANTACCQNSKPNRGSPHRVWGLVWLALLGSLQVVAGRVYPPQHFCSYLAPGMTSCPLCDQDNACNALASSQFADAFYTDGRYCSLPPTPENVGFPTIFNASNVCPNSNGSPSIQSYDIVGGPLTDIQVVGQAQVFLSVRRRLYITLKFMCSYMFNTEPAFQPQRVSAAVWQDTSTRWPCYVDVLYAPGYYNCYTLSVDLYQVCDASREAAFTASPNDPDRVHCSCPNSKTCQTVNLAQAHELFLTVNVWLTSFNQANGSSTCDRDVVRSYTLRRGNTAGTVVFLMPDCVPPPPSAPVAPCPPPPAPPSPPPPAPSPPPAPPPPPAQRTTFQFQSPVHMPDDACESLVETFEYLLYTYKGQYVAPVHCVGPDPMQPPFVGDVAIVSIYFVFQNASDEFIDYLAPVNAASGQMKYMVNKILKAGRCKTAVTIVGRSAPRSIITIPDVYSINAWPELFCAPASPPPLPPPKPPGKAPSPPSTFPPPPPPPSPKPPPPCPSPSPPPSPPPPSPPPPVPPGSPFTLIISFNAPVLVDQCSEILFILEFTAKTISAPLQRASRCERVASTLVHAYMEFVDDTYAEKMMLVMTPHNVGAMVEHMGWPCGSQVVATASSDVVRTFSSANVHELECDPHYPNPKPWASICAPCPVCPKPAPAPSPIVKVVPVPVPVPAPAPSPIVKLVPVPVPAPAPSPIVKVVTVPVPTPAPSPSPVVKVVTVPVPVPVPAASPKPPAVPSPKPSPAASPGSPAKSPQSPSPAPRPPSSTSPSPTTTVKAAPSPSPSPKPLPIWNGGLSITLSIEAKRSPPLSQGDCDVMIEVMDAAMRSASISGAAKPKCTTIKLEGGAVGAVVNLVLTAGKDVDKLMGVVASEESVASLAMSLDLPCEGSVVVINQRLTAAGGNKDVQVTFNKTNLAYAFNC